MADGNSGCKCKKGFKDVKDPESWKDQKGDDDARTYVDSLTEGNGYVCVENTCETRNVPKKLPISALLFVIDGSGSINDLDYTNFDKMRDFLYKGSVWLPKSIRIFFQQYETKAQFARGVTPVGWDKTHYDRAVRDAIHTYGGGTTSTYAAILDVTNWWISYNPNPRKALMIIITDGVPYMDPGLANRQGIIDHARNNGIDIKYVAVGNFDRHYMDLDVLDRNKDIITMTSYQDLQDTLREPLVPLIVCASIDRQQVEEARRRAYE